MKKNTRLFFAALLLGSTAAHAATLKLATTSSPPFTGAPGQSRIVNDLVEEALGRSGVASTTTVVQEGTLTLRIKAHNFDGSPGLWRDTDREAFLIYSTPLAENRLVLMGKKGSDVSAINFAALKGKRVGIVEGFSYGEDVTSAKGVVFVTGASHQENLDKLRAGQIDYMLVEELMIRQLLAVQGDEIRANLQIGNVPLVKRTLHFVLRKDVPDANAIMAKFNSNLKAMLADGTYNRLLNLAWIEADVDGDGKTELIPLKGRVGRAPPTGEYSVFSSSMSSTDKKNYYVNGQVYNDWNKVPAAYKSDVIPPTSPSTSVMRFKF